MIARRTLLSLSALLLVLAGCGDGDASEGPSTTTTAAASPTTTSAPTTVPPTTTTTPPTTTTVAPTTTTTTQPPGMHQEASVLWDDLLPDADATALYRVDMVVPDTPMSHQWGVAGEFEGRMEYGVEWFGREGTYDRFVLGLDPLETPGLVFYFRLDDPWVVDFFAMEAWADGNVGRGPSGLEEFSAPATLDLSGQSGEMFTLNGVVTALDSYGVDELDAALAVTLLDPGAGPVTVGAGEFEQVMLYEIVISGPIVGGPDFPIEVLVGPGNFILKMSMPGAEIEMLEPWG